MSAGTLDEGWTLGATGGDADDGEAVAPGAETGWERADGASSSMTVATAAMAARLWCITGLTCYRHHSYKADVT